ncbi:hypothetical protein [Curtobacterium sp. PhB146]|uniref:hypothetical protein n=1 Tax=Curtobacterium sp. PhB146 TaxID=2485187 RepID=UPI001050119C|nr:hypothetical protein [Curtobacterium sp. PhB146]TCU48346.1 hypothetical protein EDF33_102237 [Curtobacterium sp. PhB146]
MAGFDASKLTLGEIEKVEDISRLSIDQIGEDGVPKARMLSALVYVIKRREDPTFQFDQAREFTQDQALELLGVGDDENEDEELADDVDPTQPAASDEPAPAI